MSTTGVEELNQETFDPLTATYHQAFTWDDGVHRIVGTSLSGGAICYETACGHFFALPLLGLPISEYKLGNPVVTCRRCK